MLSGKHVPNSLEAVLECAQANVPRLEIDIQFLRDDSMLVFHDSSLGSETTGQGPVTALDLAAARQLRFRRDESVRVPFLEDVVDVLRGCDSVLQVDLKLVEPFTPARLERFLEALRPLGERALIGSQSHWNVRATTGHGYHVGIDPTLQWNAASGIAEIDHAIPSGRGIHGLWDDATIALIPGRPAQAYLRERVTDIIGLLPGASEWMVDIITIKQIATLGLALGDVLAELGIELAAWTMRDQGRDASGALLSELFDLGVTTVITDDTLALASYVA